MSMKKLLAAAFTCVLMAAAVCGCGSASVTQETVTPPDYTEMTALITSYEDAYRAFVQAGEGDVEVVTSEGCTPLGAPCSAKYTNANNGLYESCSLVVQRDVEQYDEYFNIGNGIMMFTRFYTVGTEMILHKYICYSNAVFYVNDETQTMDRVEDVEALDCFVTFDQVRRVYGASAQDIAPVETALSA